MKNALNIKTLITKTLVVGILFLISVGTCGAEVISTNVFSLASSDYSHIVIETSTAVSHSMLILKNPNRVVLDLKNSPINIQLLKLSNKNFAKDVCIKQVRVGNFKVGVTRIVFDLRTEVKALLNVDKPHGKYQHRLMLDLYPLQSMQKTNNHMHLETGMAHEDPNTSDSKSTGAKIILEPPSYDETLMDEQEHF